MREKKGQKRENERIAINWRWKPQNVILCRRFQELGSSFCLCPSLKGICNVGCCDAGPKWRAKCGLAELSMAVELSEGGIQGFLGRLLVFGRATSLRVE